MTGFYIDLNVSENKKIRVLSEADEADLRIFSAAVLFSDEDGGFDVSDICEALGISATEASGSVKFWKGAGIFTSAPSEKKEENTNVTTAHKGGAISHAGVEDYTNEELAGILESNIRPAFVDEAQKAMGKMFNKNEVSKLIGIVDQLGFEEEAVLAILSYCVRLDKKSISYAEKIALTFHDQDVSTAEQVHAQIDYLERRNSNIEKIRGLYGFGGRALTTAEKKYFATWTEEYGFDFEIIKLAYEITVDTIVNPAPRYTAKILQRWYENGLSTLDAVKAFIASERDAKKQAVAVSAKSGQSAKNTSDIDDWYEQKLKRQFGDKI